MREGPVNRLEPHWQQAAARGSTTPDRVPHPLSDTAKSWEENLERFMADHPKLMVAAAAAVGVVLGWMVKRK
jgi:ElaB/YqjD/DUF883 family membrane-anchored ribosome-binding protein